MNKKLILLALSALLLLGGVGYSGRGEIVWQKQCAGIVTVVQLENWLYDVTCPKAP